MNTQVCNTCKIEKELKEFYKDKTKILGVGGKCKICRKKYTIKNKERYTLLANKYRIESKEKNLSYSKKYYRANKEYYKEYNKKYRQGNRDKFKKYKEDRKIITNKNLKNRRKSDPMFKLQGTLRNRIYTMFKFKHWKKNKRTEEMLGASFEEVKIHLENTFTEGMNWGNHGDWHIDHKIPLDSANTEKELYRLCHYANLQALWAFDNISKSNKIS